MGLITVLGTGGTIASTKNAQGASIADCEVHDLLERVTNPGFQTRSRDIFQLGSFQMGHSELRRICQEVESEIADPDVDGVVITHGTDTMEETAYLLDLVHDSPKPVVLTGAQRAADATNADGPENLREAIAVAASPLSRQNGVLICFSGSIHAARATRKGHTLAARPFTTNGSEAVGHVVDGVVTFNYSPRRPPPLAPPTAAFDQTRVDIVTVHPGADSALAQAAVAAGASGVVIAGTGAGNGNKAFLAWVRDAVKEGIVVGLGTRVSDGPVVPIYGNGGGIDLTRAGAIGLGNLPLFQGRILLALKLSQDAAISADLLGPYVYPDNWASEEN